ncbi:hypothetical protein [Streptomyces sp. NPDC016845]|uniref:hypothetical protein n=1 Tax=Streptomyces sp. NPDC016845 TaxID=3364972 RepID=UPI0037B0FE7C
MHVSQWMRSDRVRGSFAPPRSIRSGSRSRARATATNPYLSAVARSAVSRREAVVFGTAGLTAPSLRRADDGP